MVPMSVAFEQQYESLTDETERLNFLTEKIQELKFQD